MTVTIRTYPLRVIRGLSTVSVYRMTNRGRDSFCLVWYIGGERHRRTLADEEEAVREATTIAEQLADGQAALTKVTRRDLEYYQTCERAVAPVPLHVVVDQYLRAHPQRVRSVPLAQAVKEFIARNEADGRSKRHVQTLRHHLHALARDIPKTMNEISTQELDNWLMTTNWSSRTRVNHITSFVSLWKWARDKGYVPDGVRTEADKLRRPRVRPADPVPFTPAELAALLRMACPRSAPVILLGAYAGLRQKEITRIRWSDFDWQAGQITLGSAVTKTSKRRMVPINDTLRAWLQPLAVALEQAGTRGPVQSKADPQRWTKQTSVNAGVDWRRNGLRKGYVSYRMAQAQDSRAISNETGHTPSELESSYKALVGHEAAQQWFGLQPGDGWHQRVLANVPGPHPVAHFQ